MKEKFAKLQEMVAAIVDDVEAASGGNKAAGTRVRKAMQDIKNMAQEVRLAVLDIRAKK